MLNPLAFGSSPAQQLFSGRNRQRLARDGSQDLFLEARYNQNPFAVASQRLARKKTYQQQCTQYEKELTQTRSARLVGAAINWSPWVVFLSGNKLVEKVAGALPAEATLPGLILFSIATNPFLPEVQEKLMKAWRQPPELLKRKSQLDRFSQTARQSPALVDLAQWLEQSEHQSGNRLGHRRDWWSVFRFSRGVNYEQLAREMAMAMISPYQERQDLLRKVLPQLRGTPETRKHIVPALNRLLDEADERTSLLPAGAEPHALQSVVEDTVELSSQESRLLAKSVDSTEERGRYQIHLRRAIPALIRYLDVPSAGQSLEV